MLNNIFSHWKTTLSGVALAVLQVVLNGRSTSAISLALATAIVGAVAKDPDSRPGNQSLLKVLLLVGCLLCFAVPDHAQASPTPAPATAPLTNIYAAGISFNHGGSPGIAGTGLYARLISDGSGTYAFTVVDALPTSIKPFTVTSNFGMGIAQKVFTIGKVPIFVPSSAGVSYNGTNTGWAWSTGGLASIRIKNNWRIFPNVRIVKSSVSNGSGYQPIVGVLFGWGQ